MTAPAFLPTLLSVLLIAAAGYTLWRLLVSPVLGLANDIEADAPLPPAGIATAGLLSNWAHTLPRAPWTALFAAAGCYFAARAVSVRADPRRRGRAAVHACGCAILVYAFLSGVGPSSVHGSTAGQYVMAGMPGMIVDSTIAFPALGLACVGVMAFYAVCVVARLSPAGVAAGSRAAFAPLSVEICRVLIAFALVYAILSMLV
ncbi:DUF5134 domain-containing protein [Actinospica durhamensis]|uniref:DUF5134 domain-containing protein n=1 Tax=Actinospica durhamensis TaxID=1508375 RepID=A0A941EM96_9ACTN|nr:DUF5134 domain-containing protein [Actinospica durhamensis]MBR7832968.1 DUF5134 domain-containing protein [Actinospica durhamensis]